VPKTINYKEKECKELVPITPINSVIALTKVYDSFATTADLSSDSDDYWYLLEKWFIFALIWSVCASVDENSR